MEEKKGKKKWVLAFVLLCVIVVGEDMLTGSVSSAEEGKKWRRR